MDYYIKQVLQGYQQFLTTCTTSTTADQNFLTNSSIFGVFFFYFNHRGLSLYSNLYCIRIMIMNNEAHSLKFKARHPLNPWQELVIANCTDSACCNLNPHVSICKSIRAAKEIHLLLTSMCAFLAPSARSR